MFRFSAALLLSTALLAPHATQAQTPQLAADTGSHDFGIVGLGTTPEFNFPIRNAGTAPLELKITSVPRGLRLVHIDQMIPPKTSGVVRLGIDTFQAGPTTEWHVAVLTNDPTHGSLDLTVKADVRAFLRVSPDAARFNFVQFGPEGGTTHVLSSQDDSPLEVLGIDPPVDFIRGTARELKGKEHNPEVEGRQWEIKLTISPAARVGPIAGYVVIRTNHPRQPNAYLAVSGFVRPLFAVTPPAINLTGMAASTPDSPILSLVVKNFGTEPLTLTGATSDIPGLDAKIVDVDKTGHAWNVDLRLAPGGAKGPFKGTLTLKTSSKDVPELKVPVQGERP